MHDSLGRREDFQVVTKSNVYPQRCCATRLVENKCVAGRMLEVWPNFKKCNFGTASQITNNRHVKATLKSVMLLLICLLRLK